MKKIEELDLMHLRLSQKEIKYTKVLVETAELELENLYLKLAAKYKLLPTDIIMGDGTIQSKLNEETDEVIK